MHPRRTRSSLNSDIKTRYAFPTYIKNKTDVSPHDHRLIMERRLSPRKAPPTANRRSLRSPKSATRAPESHTSKEGYLPAGTQHNTDSIENNRKTSPRRPPSSVCPVCRQKFSSSSVSQHIETHANSTSDTDGILWRCKGVRVEDAPAYRVPMSSPMYTHNNVIRIGGCLRTFRRRDALTRHLLSATSCFGTASRDSSVEV